MTPTNRKTPMTASNQIDIINSNSMANAIERDIIKAEQEASRLGAMTGSNAAEWFAQDNWGGRVTRGEKEAAQSFLSAYDDGGELPELPNLSGEWADSETPASLMVNLFGDDWQDTPEFVEAQDDLCQAWEDACCESFYSSLVKSAQSLLS
jgi:hypothetical protein